MGMMARRLATVFLLLGTVCGPVMAEEVRQVPRTHEEALLSFAPVAKLARPGVVNVYASRVDKLQRNPLFDDPVFRQFFGEAAPRHGGQTARSLGSGVIVDGSGLVVTNYHVIDGMTDVKVALSDNREIGADIVLRDKRTDLAVLRLKDKGPYPVVELGDSDALEVGDLVLAIGDPFGVGQTVTQGIVSGLARSQIGGGDYQYFIQTDAAINPGNSGGALVDMHARLIGINSAIYSQSGGNVGIGFAIPVNLVKTVIQAAKGGRRDVQRPWLGASLQTLTREIADTMNLPRASGALVSSVMAHSPAEKSGLKAGDVITGFDGVPVDDPEALSYRFATHPLGSTASLGVFRDGKTLSVPIELAAAPEIPPREPVKIANASPFAGATVVNLSPAVMDAMSLDGVQEGVVVTEVESSSNAAQIGLERGDVIVGIDGQAITSSRQFEKVTGSGRGYYRITLARGGHMIQTEVGG